jgi:hypothetical protein
MPVDSGLSGCNLSLEILKGCGYSCGDCSVDKGFTAIDISEEMTNSLIALVDSFPNTQYKKLELTIGPTDLVSSDNGISVLKEPLVIELARRYKFLAIPLSLLSDKGLVELCKVVDTYLPTVQLIINVPATIKNLNNPKYIAMLADRVELFKSNIKVAVFKRINLNVNLIKDNVSSITADEDRLIQKIKFQGVETAIEYGFGHSRKGFNNLLDAEQMARDLKTFSFMVHEQADTRFNRMLVPRCQDTIEMVYRAGRLFQLPVIQERFPIFDDTFEIPTPWTISSVLETKENIYLNNLCDYSEHPTCGDCCFLASCAQGDTISLMRVLKRDDCPIAMKNRYDLHPSMTLGEYE